MPREQKRIAAIDIGTNSIHMIIAELRRGGYRVVDREKEMVRLGLNSLDGQPLTAEAIERGVASIARMREIADRWNASDIIAVATSAVREAPNRHELLRRVRETAGIDVQVISGEEEADYIFRAVRSSVGLDDGTALCIDIGGGSVELIVGTAGEICFTRSEPLGALRLAQRFSLDDLPAASAVEACRRFVRKRLAKLRKTIRTLGADVCIATSGTVLALASLEGNGADAPMSHGLRRLERDAITEAARTLASMSNSERVARFGFDEKRSASIVAGAIVLEEILTVFDIGSLLACPAAIREGIVESRIGKIESKRHSGGSVRQASVVALAERTDCDIRHGRHVARIAARIFDGLRDLHQLPESFCELLEYAAMLHESGMHVSDRGHDMHSYYLIRHADLRGFTEEQLAIIASVARFYRKAPPDDWREVLAELNPSHHEAVRKLTAMLRIAEALDRGHHQRVRDVSVAVADGDAVFHIQTDTGASVEITTAMQRAKYFRRTFGVKPRFIVE